MVPHQVVFKRHEHLRAPRVPLPRPCRIRLKIGKPLDFAAEPDRREGWERVAEAVRGAVMGLE